MKDCKPMCVCVDFKSRNVLSKVFDNHREPTHIVYHSTVQTAQHNIYSHRTTHIMIPPNYRRGGTIW